MRKNIVKIISLILISTMLVTGCSSENNSVSVLDANLDNSRTYECDYHTLALNTSISTTISDNEVNITGNIFRFATDPLKMTDTDGNVIGQATDDYNLISQDDHAIIIRDKFEIGIKGKFNIIGQDYDLIDSEGKHCW